MNLQEAEKVFNYYIKRNKAFLTNGLKIEWQKLKQKITTIQRRKN